MANNSGAPAIQGVLFDIDDTLVDLETAMGRTLHHIGADTLAHLSEAEWSKYKQLYTRDPHGYYDQYLAGKLSFTEQRIRRARHAQASFLAEPLEGEAAARWNHAYEKTLPLHFEPYEDAVPVLDELDRRGIPYGAVSNNVHDYQRAKLDKAGLQRIAALVGIDAIGVAKPDPAIYLEGARRLGTDPGRTLYVGDNPVIDAQGADDAGLLGVWLDRSGAQEARFVGRRITSLRDVLRIVQDIR